MKRDFSESAKNELLQLVKEVGNEGGFWDTIGDFGLDFMALIGQLDITKYIDNVNKYHRKVIDKNDATAESIEKIFENVNNVSESYKSRFIACCTELEEINKSIHLLSETIHPSNGKFNAEYMGKELYDYLKDAKEFGKKMQVAAQEGLTEEDLKDMSLKDKEKLFSSYIGALIENVPEMTIPGEYRIILGPDISFYFTIDGEGVIHFDGGEAQIILNEQKNKLKDLVIEVHNNDGDSVGIHGNGSIESVNRDGMGAEITMDGDISVSYEDKEGNTTRKYTSKLNPFDGHIEIDYTVEEEGENGKLTSSCGLEKKKSGEMGKDWVPIPVEDEVPVPYPGKIPDFNYDWIPIEIDETAVTIVAVVGMIIITPIVIETILAPAAVLVI